MAVNRRELLRLVAVLAAVWVLAMLLLSALQRRAKPAQRPSEPRLVHYPGYENVEEQTSVNLGFRKYWFTLNEEYPSKSVYYFYRNLLEPKGWRPLTEGEPQWARQTDKREAHDVFHAMWISPDNLFQIELEMLSTVQLVHQQDAIVPGEREPGIQVFVTQRRVLHPGIIFQPRAPAPERGVPTPDL